MSWEFKPGMKVVCVDDNTRTAILYSGRHIPCATHLKVGAIYTIREVGFIKFNSVETGAYEGVGIKLSGIYRRIPYNPPPPLTRDDVFFGADRFRPLEEKKHSIEIFRQIARDITEKKVVGDEITALQDMLDEHLPVDFHQFGGRPIL